MLLFPYKLRFPGDRYTNRFQWIMGCNPDRDDPRDNPIMQAKALQVSTGIDDTSISIAYLLYYSGFDPTGFVKNGMLK